jgi:hypothetical protein
VEVALVGDYRYAGPPDLWVQDDHVIAGRDMPDELIPDRPWELVTVQLVRDDAGQVVGAYVWESTWHPPMVVPPEAEVGPGRWVPIA